MYGYSPVARVQAQGQRVILTRTRRVIPPIHNILRAQLRVRDPDSMTFQPTEFVKFDHRLLKR